MTIENLKKQVEAISKLKSLNSNKRNFLEKVKSIIASSEKAVKKPEVK